MKCLRNDKKDESTEYSEIAATSNSNTIHQNFEMNIYNGKGSYETGVNNTFWTTLIITAKIIQPQDGIWKIVIRDGAKNNAVVYKNSQVLQDEEISFDYKTGLKVNLLIEATWNQSKNTTLIGEISISY